LRNIPQVENSPAFLPRWSSEIQPPNLTNIYRFRKHVLIVMSSHPSALVDYYLPQVAICYRKTHPGWQLLPTKGLLFPRSDVRQTEILIAFYPVKSYIYRPKNKSHGHS